MHHQSSSTHSRLLNALVFIYPVVKHAVNAVFVQIPLDAKHQQLPLSEEAITYLRFTRNREAKEYPQCSPRTENPLCSQGQCPGHPNPPIRREHLSQHRSLEVQSPDFYLLRRSKFMATAVHMAISKRSCLGKADAL